MVLFDTDISPFEQVNVALDLETTGLDSNRHQILEVGAVRFRGDEVIETYQTLVNPGVAIPEFIQRLTHISPQQVKRAPFFSSVASEIEDFLGADPIIGHNNMRDNCKFKSALVIAYHLVIVFILFCLNCRQPLSWL